MHASLKVVSSSALKLLATFLLAGLATASATVFSFNTDPFAGTTAPATPGRQVVGGESFITFSIATDVFAFDPAAFGVSSLNLANTTAAGLPSSGVNVIVLQTFDNDANSTTPFGAANAADLIANAITTPGPGFFIYFNSSLDLPRLVYSTNLGDNTADLRILARLTNLNGQLGRDAFATFTSANFQLVAAPVPETGGVLLLLMAGGALALGRRYFGRSGRRG
jgi:hypothetical protein